MACASCSICMTSSRVGARIRTRGLPTRRPGGDGWRSRRVNRLIRNAAVLPVPVCARPAASTPRSVFGRMAAWIGVQY